MSARLKWDEVGERLYETGTKKGVLYVQDGNSYPTGVAWNGWTGFSESPDGGEANDIYADDIKYLSIRSRENFKGTITAYTYPDEFAQCDGSAAVLTGVNIGQQSRKPFGLSYVTTIGNDTEFEDHGYKIHIVYGATAAPSSKDYKTINDSPEAIEFSWEIDTTPVAVSGYKPTAHIELDSTKLTSAQLTAVENALYGAETDVYEATTDTSPKSGKTYYTRTGTSPNYTYTKFTGTTFTQGTTYYENTSGPHLPLPDDLIYLIEHAS